MDNELEKIIENIEKIEVIVASNFATKFPNVAMEVRSLAQEALREARSLLTSRAADMCPYSRSGKHKWEKALQSYEICYWCGTRR